MKFQSTKVFDGYSCCFRQWKAVDTHCKFLHGYAVSFKVTFEGDLDIKNWVFDFGGAKRSTYKIDGKNPKEYLDWLLDHTVIISSDDPHISSFKMLDNLGVIQLRVLDIGVGAERFAEYLYLQLNPWILQETDNRVKIVKIEFFENQKNSAIYEE